MEASNVKAMHEALLEIDELTNLLDIPEDKKNLLVSPSHSFIAVKMRKIIKKALEEPPRNMEANDMKAMREALSALIPVAEHGLNARTHSLNCTVGATNVEAARALVEQAKEAIADAKAALAKPPRNCDVGTIDEQYQKYHALGEVYHTLTLANALAWAQKPYEAPVEEESNKEEPEEPETPPRLDICPKCGKDAARFIHPTFDVGTYVSCRECHYSPQAETWAPTAARAAVRWNNLKR